ncbi:MAG: T9SS C-terminal target domain-containing protein, partial [Calditrichaeota bacterium]
PHSVQRLVKAVAEAKIENVIMLSGDSHTAAIDDGANALFPEIMAGALDRTNSREVALAQSFALNKWNRGGQTIERNNFNSHYGRVTVFGQDSVRMELIDEFGELITRYTLPAGHLVSPVSLTLAPEGQNFGEVQVGQSNVLPIIFINAGADTVHVTKLSISDPQFSPLFFFGLTLPPGKAQNVGFSFKPTQEGEFLAFLTVESNDPQSPFVVPLAGKGISATGIGEQKSQPPESFALRPNYPNPFNAGTRISYDLAKKGEVSLSIFNLRGQLVRQFRFSAQGPGRYHISWDGRDAAGRPMASGVYTYRLRVIGANGDPLFSQSRKMLYLK